MSLNNPNDSIDSSLDVTQQLFKLIEALKAHPKAHLDWVGTTASKVFTVAKHMAKTIDLERLKRSH